jgi:hypothetical protein
MESSLQNRIHCSNSIDIPFTAASLSCSVMLLKAEVMENYGILEASILCAAVLNILI